MNPRIISVKPEEGYKLILTFDNGEEKIFDVTPVLGIGRFSELRDPALFNSVRPIMGTIQWSNGLDLCPDMLFLDRFPHFTFQFEIIVDSLRQRLVEINISVNLYFLLGC